jgi:hypothetical protein
MLDIRLSGGQLLRDRWRPCPLDPDWRLEKAALQTEAPGAIVCIVGTDIQGLFDVEANDAKGGS